MAHNDSIFIDTSFFKAWIDEKDSFHAQALRNGENIKEQNLLPITSNFILDETLTLLRVRCGMSRISLFRSYLHETKPRIIIYRVLARDEKHAWTWFEKEWKGLSFIDSVTFAQMKRLGISRVLTFDEHFKKAGFNVVG